MFTFSGFPDRRKKEVVDDERNQIGIAIIDRTVMCLTFFNRALAQQKEDLNLIVVVNEQSYKLAENWFGFLKSELIPYKRVTASEFEKLKKEKVIVIQGGPNESDGIGEIVKSLLTREEFEWINQPGRSKMYVKADVWNKDQTIMIFAGYDREAADQARIQSSSSWWDLLCGFFKPREEVPENKGY